MLEVGSQKSEESNLKFNNYDFRPSPLAPRHVAPHPF
jgi:hypothetical protein